ncbi:MAG: GNAT family N-acetyltransferase [Candidatus Marinimicrobia bacterium]|nr:GNAT family N-acetyltransferase [Candidatus Neomarinimicrobiota bacterium]
MKVYLETERMILREFIEADVDNLVDLDSDPKVMLYINGGKPTPRQDVVERVMPHILKYYKNNDGLGIWAAMNKLDGQFMGWFLLRPNWADETETELGYRFKRQYWDQGYASEGSRALIHKGFMHLKVNVIMATADPANVASRRVMEKIGLKFEKEYAEADGFIVVKYRLGRSEYLKRGQSEVSKDPIDYGSEIR